MLRCNALKRSYELSWMPSKTVRRRAAVTTAEFLLSLPYQRRCHSVGLESASQGGSITRRVTSITAAWVETGRHGSWAMKERASKMSLVPTLQAKSTGCQTAAVTGRVTTSADSLSFQAGVRVKSLPVAEGPHCLGCAVILSFLSESGWTICCASRALAVHHASVTHMPAKWL